MALTVTHNAASAPTVVANKVHVNVSIVPDSSYPLGGEAITAAQCGLSYIERIIFEGPAVDPDTADNAGVPYFDPATTAVLFFWSNSDAADGPLIECPAATDLSAFTARAIVVGW